MKLENCGVTNHFCERYAERIKQVPKDDIKAYLTPQMVAKIAEESKDYDLEFIIQAEYHGNQSSNFYLWRQEECIIVTNKDNQSLITVFPVDFGLGAEVNSFAIAEIMQKLQMKNLEMKREVELNLDQLARLKGKQAQLQYDIASMNQQLGVLQKSANMVKEQISDVEKLTEIKEEEKKRIAHKLIYSLNYGYDSFTYKKK